MEFLYNPDAMSDDELRRTFVGREALVKDLLAFARVRLGAVVTITAGSSRPTPNIARSSATAGRSGGMITPITTVSTAKNIRKPWSATAKPSGGAIRSAASNILQRTT